MRQLSSTSSFSTASEVNSGALPWRAYLRFAAKLAIFLVCFGVIEALSYLFVPPLHPMEVASRKKAGQFQTVLDSDQRSETYFIGSSITEEGINAELFASKWGGTAYNAGLAGTANVDFAAGLVRDLIAKKKPKLIVYGIENFAFDRGARETDTQMFRFLNLYRQRDQIKKWISRTFRGKFQMPPAFWDAESHVADFDRRFRHFDKAILHPFGWVEVKAIANFDDLAGEPPPDFAYTPLHVEAIRKIMRLSKESGTAVVFVQLPQSVKSVFSTPNRREGFRRFMEEYVQNEGGIYFDFDSDLRFPRDDPNFYYDKGHLNNKGAELFAPMLVEEMAKRCTRTDEKVSCS